MNLGALLALLKLVQDTGLTKTKPIARKITIPIGKTLLLPEGFELVGPSRLGLRPPGL